jgi:phosphatidylethanolamine/phosphatidyl-N-methylethanolamine N-methyltransferase
VTRAILAAGTRLDRLVVIERDLTLHRLLGDRYPGLLVIHGDAQHLQAHLDRHGIDDVKAVVSSLPLLSMKKSVQDRIAQQVFSCLKPGRPLIQYTYGLLSPLPRRRLGIEGEVRDRVLHNLPPASVWMYRKPVRAPMRAA